MNEQETLVTVKMNGVTMPRVDEFRYLVSKVQIATMSGGFVTEAVFTLFHKPLCFIVFIHLHCTHNNAHNINGKVGLIKLNVIKTYVCFTSDQMNLTQLAQQMK